MNRVAATPATKGAATARTPSATRITPSARNNLQCAPMDLPSAVATPEGLSGGTELGAGDSIMIYLLSVVWLELIPTHFDQRQASTGHPGQGITLAATDSMGR